MTEPEFATPYDELLDWLWACTRVGPVSRYAIAAVKPDLDVDALLEQFEREGLVERQPGAVIAMGKEVDGFVLTVAGREAAEEQRA